MVTRDDSFEIEKPPWVPWMSRPSSCQRKFHLVFQLRPLSLSLSLSPISQAPLPRLLPLPSRSFIPPVSMLSREKGKRSNRGSGKRWHVKRFAVIYERRASTLVVTGALSLSLSLFLSLNPGYLGPIKARAERVELPCTDSINEESEDSHFTGQELDHLQLESAGAGPPLANHRRGTFSTRTHATVIKEPRRRSIDRGGWCATYASRRKITPPKCRRTGTVSTWDRRRHQIFRPLAIFGALIIFGVGVAFFSRGHALARSACQKRSSPTGRGGGKKTDRILRFFRSLPSPLMTEPQRDNRRLIGRRYRGSTIIIQSLRSLSAR